MSFLSRLFKKTEVETLESKITKVKLQPQEQLLNTALQSDVDQFRVAAISKLNYSSELVKIATSNQQPKHIVTIARKRIGELLDDASVSIESLSSDVSDQTTLLSLCSYSSTTGASLVDQLSDEDILLDVAQNGATTQIRQAAAQKITSREILNDLSKAAKNKDKSVLKIAKSKLDVFKEADEEESKTDAIIDAACKQAEQLSNREVDDIFHAKKRQIEDSWRELSTLAKNEAKERFHSALAICQQKLDAIEKAKKDILERATADKEAKKDLYGALHRMQEIIAHLYTHENPQTLEAELNKAQEQQHASLKEAQNRGLNVQKELSYAETLSNSARALFDKLQATGPIQKLIDELCTHKDESGKAIRKQIEALLVYSKSLKDVPPPEIISKSKASITQWSNELKEQVEKSKVKLKESSELIRKANWAISKGYVGRARAIFKDLEDSISKLDQIPSHIEAKFVEVKESMSKLGDWHEFAVTPKKQALVDKMQSLINSTLHPKDLADKIHNLQDGWKELCKGGQNQDEGLWNQFQEASQSAYERCQTYFDEQTKVRESNAALRQTLLSHLQQYESQYNWDNANWKEVEDTLRVSRETWQTYWPIPRKQIKELQEQFDGIYDRIFEIRNAEFEQNKIKKQSVVEQSAALLNSEDIQSAIESAKKLQSQWKTIGRCKRKDDQALWKIFRENCDCVFEKRNQENENHREERNAAKAQAEDIISQLETILKTDSNNFFEARAQCSSLTEQFQSIGELPKDSLREINSKYQSTIDAIEARVDDERKTAAAQQWAMVFDIANQIRSYELKCINGVPSSDLKSKIEVAIANVKKWPNNTLSALQHRLENAHNLSVDTTTTSVELLRILCIRSEIMTDNDTPPEEKAFRMTYQVNQLKDNFGQSTTTSANINNEILIEWMNAAAGSDEQYPILLKRFAKCWQLDL